MTLSSNQVMTGAAVALGLFALWFVVRGPGRAALAPSAQAQRTAQLNGYFAGLTGQSTALYQESLMESGAILRALGVSP